MQKREGTRLTTLQIQTEVPFRVLLDSLPQLEMEELDLLADEVLHLRAQRSAHHISARESELLSHISEGVIPLPWRRRIAELTKRQQAETLTPEEEDELSNLVDAIEMKNAQRVSYLVDLAELRNVTVDELISSLEIAPLTYE